MKKNYLTPKSKVYKIELNGRLLGNLTSDPTTGHNARLYDDYKDDRLYDDYEDDQNINWSFLN